ncbi:hypothetical protein BDR06DRAFT_977853 [Suillus hirtellus]|nr:hypothetical protein BDR06DRAFT_977853 [Suillus hirtellus]
MFSSPGNRPYIFHQLTCSMEDTMKKDPAHKVLEDSTIVIPADNVAEVLLMDEFHENVNNFYAKFHPLAKELEETEVLVADQCHTETDDLCNIIQGISKEGQTLRCLVTNIKSSHSQGLGDLEGAVADLDARFSNYKDPSQRSIRCKSALERQVSKVQNSQGVHGQILCMSAQELGILCLELENSQCDTHELQQACSSFWRTIVDEIENIRNGVISENSLPPCPRDDLHNKMLRSNRIIEEDSVQTPCIEVAGASATVIPFHSKSSADLADTCGLLALGKYLVNGILPNITVKNHISRMHIILLGTGFWLGILDAASFLTMQWKGYNGRHKPFPTLPRDTWTQQYIIISSDVLWEDVEMIGYWHWPLNFGNLRQARHKYVGVQKGHWCNHCVTMESEKDLKCEKEARLWAHPETELLEQGGGSTNTMQDIVVNRVKSQYWIIIWDFGYTRFRTCELHQTGQKHLGQSTNATFLITG